MANLYARYAALKQKIGGNRESWGYEETFGLPFEEAHHITPPPRFLVRILSETEFCIRLSEKLDHRYDTDVDAALAVLEAGLEADGVVTKSVADRAEQALMPLAGEAKSYRVIFAGHAHIDMNWMWSFQETVAATVATFRTMLDIMDEYPEFCFSQSQTSVYKIIDDYAPEMKERIQKRIREGRWEVNAGAWVETDKNMPNGESLLRHILYSKAYLKKHWDIPASDLEVDFSPDTFGHSFNIPEIDLYGGLKYMYHCRGLNGKDALYRWRGQSGKELLVYREQYWYNSGITPKPCIQILDVSARCAGLRTGLAVYGVGDHGGGPTRRDVERGIEMMGWPVFPTVKFGTFREFFRIAESVREELPVIDHELNCIFPGCYTTQTRIKLGNRRSEAALSEAENLLAASHVLLGSPEHADALENAWQKVLFTHFHDILTGSCVQDSREYAMGLYQETLATANTEAGLSMSRIADATDTSSVRTERDPASQAEGAGVGYNIGAFAGRAVDERGNGKTRIWTVFNNTYADKDEPVEITCWDWRGDLRLMDVTDLQGNPLPVQRISGEEDYWSHKLFRFLVRVKVPALSYTTVVLREKERTDYPIYFQGDTRTHTPARNPVLENEYIRCEFDYGTGEMVSLTDKESGRELLAQGGRGRLEIIDTNRHTSNAWEIGVHMEKHPLNAPERVNRTMGGPLRSSVSVDLKARSSTFRILYTLDAGDRFVRARIHADWHEIGGDTIPVLAYELPLSYATDAYRYNIPAGVITRPAAEADRPGQSYIQAMTEEKQDCAAIVADSKYGFRGFTRDGHANLISTLINSATRPDLYPERGIHDIVLSVGFFPYCPSCMERKAQSAIRPLTVVSTGSHKGALPAEATWLKTECMGGMVSAVYAEGDRLYVRMYSVADMEKTFSVTSPKPLKDAWLCDPYGVRTGDVRIEGDTVSAKAAPHGILTFCLSL